MEYNPWPLGPLPEEFQRPELQQLRDKGYEFQDARNVVTKFENKMEKFTGAPYASAVDCCTNAIFLCLKFLKASGTITLPAHTYASVPMTIMHAGCTPQLAEIKWHSKYQLAPTPIWDAATAMYKGMYDPGTMMCLSFQLKKKIPIGRGGMILTDNPVAAAWFRTARFSGRHNVSYDKDQFELGWQMYMTPEDAARGILIFDRLMERDGYIDASLGWEYYTDLREQELFNAKTTSRMR